MGIRKLCLSSDDLWKDELDLIGADPATWGRLEGKCGISVFLTDTYSCTAANIIKQCMLSGGADAIVSRNTISCRDQKTRCLILGTPKQIARGCESLRGQPFGLSDLSLELMNALENPPVLPLRIRTPARTLDFRDGPLIMGILNVTPDSFSDGGRFLEREDAVEHARLMVSQGADIIDIGAESTRPGSQPVDPEQQMDRILPVIEEISAELDATISVDTASSAVAEEAIGSGAGLINDVTALSDPKMAQLASSRGVPLILMHMKGTPENMQDAPEYSDLMGEVYGYLRERIGRAEEAGVPREMIIVDPGIGFGKRLQDNLKLIARISEFHWLGCRVLLGHSRKSFLGALTGIEEPWRREAGTHAVTAISSSCADIFRVHDVEGTKQVLQVAGRLKRTKC